MLSSLNIYFTIFSLCNIIQHFDGIFQILTCLVISSFTRCPYIILPRFVIFF